MNQSALNGPLELDDDDDRTASERRSRLLMSGVATSVVNRVAASLAPLLMIPIALNELGADGFGAWATVVSFTAVLAFADLGVGSGVMTRLSTVMHVGEYEASASRSGTTSLTKARTLVTSAYVLVAAIGVSAATAFILLWWLTDVSVLVGASEADGVEWLVGLTLLAFVINIPVSMIVRVQSAVGRQSGSNAWQTAGSLLSVAAVVGVARLELGPAWFIVAATYTPVVVGVVNTIAFYRLSPLGRSVAPNLALASRATLVDLLRVGSTFFVVSLLLTLSVAMDPWIVSQTSTLSELADFNIPYRMFAAIGSVGVMLALPLWPLQARAVAAGDVDWVRRITRRMTLASVVTLAGSAGFVLVLGDQILDLWVGDEFAVDQTFWLGLGLWVVLQGALGPAFMVQNGAGLLRYQGVGYALLICALPVKFWVSSTYGYVWLPWTSCALYLVLIVPACLVGYQKAIDKAELFGADAKE